MSTSDKSPSRKQDDEETFVSFADASELGFKLVEMADRVFVAHKIVPGSQARWLFEMDGHRFAIVVTVESPQAAA